MSFIVYGYTKIKSPTPKFNLRTSSSSISSKSWTSNILDLSSAKTIKRRLRNFVGPTDFLSLIEESRTNSVSMETMEPISKMMSSWVIELCFG
ncbi:hypothetical protein L484_015908 [Morus notabilis]|uniref:Uncharacterized protein n=1 Tax=Morus notabilis TaxID=981085 RepID=W9RBB0_9ROSA|nr:hypothetical protein L484_015908 [Morus notabilis]